jgi:hypothetical protein
MAANETSGTFGAITGKARRLLVTLAENADSLPDTTLERATLERELVAAEEAKSRQDAFVGEKQRATHQVKESLGRAKEAFIQLQSAAKFKLGPHNEKLASYLVKPLRRRGPRLSTKLKKQEEELRRQEAGLREKELDLLRQKEGAERLKKAVDDLKREVEAADLNR